MWIKNNLSRVKTIPILWNLFLRVIKPWLSLNSIINQSIPHGYRSYISIRVHNLLSRNLFIAYRIQNHTSRKTQHCDVCVSGVFKKMNQIVSDTVDPYRVEKFRMYSFTKLVRLAFYESFTYLTITSRFGKSGIWLLDPTRLLSVPL